MPEGVLALGVIPFEKFDGGIFGERTREVPVLSVDLCGEHIGREARADALGDLKRSDAILVLLYVAVGECNANHIYRMNC